MCNLYRLNRVPEEVAHYFGALKGSVGNFGAEGGEVYPGYRAWSSPPSPSSRA